MLVPTRRSWVTNFGREWRQKSKVTEPTIGKFHTNLWMNIVVEPTPWMSETQYFCNNSLKKEEEEQDIHLIITTDIWEGLGDTFGHPVWSNWAYDTQTVWYSVLISYTIATGYRCLAKNLIWTFPPFKFQNRCYVVDITRPLTCVLKDHARIRLDWQEL